MIRRLVEAMKRLHRENESGQVMTEFAIVFPAQFFAILAIMQFSLLLVGHLLVQHAAFCAARAALTGDIPTSGAKATNGPQEAAEKAACFVLAPIAPGDADVQNTSNPAKGYAVAPSGWNVRQKGAYEHTKVEVYTDDPAYVGAIVEHDFYLVIPVVGRWFASGMGQFFTKGGGYAAFNAASKKHNLACLTIKKAGYVPRPWKVK